VRLKNYRAGFGWVSRCEREAMTLQALESCGLPGPQWLACRVRSGWHTGPRTTAGRSF
jgi:hypothetical protein